MANQPNQYERLAGDLAKYKENVMGRLKTDLMGGKAPPFGKQPQVALSPEDKAAYLATRTPDELAAMPPAELSALQQEVGNAQR